MECEACEFTLPDDWPGCRVEVTYPSHPDRPAPAVRIFTILCSPCRRDIEDPRDVRTAAMTEYRALPPHQPPGRHAQPATEEPVKPSPYHQVVS